MVSRSCPHGHTRWPRLAAHAHVQLAIVAAMRLVFERMKMVIEPSAAVAVAVREGLVEVTVR